MNLLLHLDQSRPVSGGGYIAMRRLARALRAQGHTVDETALHRLKPEGKAQAQQYERLSLKGRDALLTSASINTRHARRDAQADGIPVIAFVHSAMSIDPRLQADVVVWGSAALMRYAADKKLIEWRDCGWRDYIMWPLIFPDEVRVSPLNPPRGERITLINLSPAKGGRIFREMIDLAPDLQFLGVKGWGEQCSFEERPNLKILPWIQDPRSIYERTKILLYMKGEHCSDAWLNGVGLTALEAAVSGIPTVYYPGPGLLESVGLHGVQCESFDPEEWIENIEHVLANQTYWSEEAKISSIALEPVKQTAEFITVLEETLRR